MVRTVFRFTSKYVCFVVWSPLTVPPPLPSPPPPPPSSSSSSFFFFFFCCCCCSSSFSMVRTVFRITSKYVCVVIWSPLTVSPPPPVTPSSSAVVASPPIPLGHSRHRPPYPSPCSPSRPTPPASFSVSSSSAYCLKFDLQLLSRFLRYTSLFLGR